MLFSPVTADDRRTAPERPRSISGRISDETRRDAGLSDPDLWLRYFELGGMSTPAELTSYLRRGVAQSDHDHDVLALALNERFSELGRSQIVDYVGIGR